MEKINLKNIFARLKDYASFRLDKAFGVDISDGSVEILELRGLISSYPRSYGRVKLSEGMVRGGEIKDKEALSQKIAEALSIAKPKKVSTHKVFFALPETKTFLYDFQVEINTKDLPWWRPGKEAKILESRVIDEMKKNIPIELSDSYWNWKASLISSDKNVKTYKIVTASAPKYLVRDYLDVFNKLGLEVVEVVIEASSLKKSLLNEEKFPATVVFDMGARTTHMIFYDLKGNINLSATSDIAGNKITQNILDSLEVSWSKAEELKKRFGLSGGGEKSGSEVSEAVRSVIDELIEEFREAMNYYKEKYSQAVDRILLAGGSSLIKGLEEYLSEKLNLEVEVGDPLDIIGGNLDDRAEVSSPLLANVVGLAMMGWILEKDQLSLLPDSEDIDIKSTPRRDLIKLGHLSKLALFRSYLSQYRWLVVSIIVILFAFLFWIVQVEILNPIGIRLTGFYNIVQDIFGPIINILGL